MVSKLIVFAGTEGYELSFGEAFRTPEQAAWNAQHGKGITQSLHQLRIAVDLNLFRNGVFLTNLSDWMPLGAFWESLGGSWGGRFSKPDADHFSIEHGGFK